MRVNKITLFAVFILAYLLAWVISILFTCHYSSAPIQNSSGPVDSFEWMNDAGDIVSSIKADPSYFEQHDKELIDSMAKVYKIKPKNIIEYVVIHEQGESDIPQSGTTSIDYFPIDSNKKDCPPVAKNMRQTFTSPYYIAAVQVGDSPYLRLQSFDTVTVLWKKVNEGPFFNRRHLIQLDVSTANPDTKVSGLKAYRITEKPKGWAIGVQLGYGVYLKGIPQFVPYAGLGITKTIIRF